MRLIQKAFKRTNLQRPPIWLMRQAGRYHAHYQALRRQHSFVDLCCIPELACEATLGPIRDFDFDVAILFSDLLFPLDALGMQLTYPEVGGPQLGFYLSHYENFKRLRTERAGLVELLKFQGQALQKIRSSLPSEKGLLGFVGGPFTLYCYAVEGRHAGSMDSVRAGLYDGRWELFCDFLLELLIENMKLQAASGIDGLAVLDTCAGELDAELYAVKVVPVLKKVLQKFQESYPEVPCIYYSKGTNPQHWAALKELPMAALGVDWKQDLVQVLEAWSDRWAIQGNIDPQWLFLPKDELERRLRQVWGVVRSLPSEKRQGWICGLGHGVLPKTPEANVAFFVQLCKEIFSD